MEEQDPRGFKPWEKLETEGRGPYIVQVGTIMQFLTGEDPRQIKQEPDKGLQQAWETQWQEFLKIMQAPQSGWKNVLWPQAGPEEHAGETHAFLEGAAQWSQGEGETPSLPGLNGESFTSPMKVAGKIVTEDWVSLETQRQRFRQFCYREAKGPREVFKRLYELCCQWLKPERYTKHQMLELLILEQFLTILPWDMQNWVRQRDPETCTQAVALAEDFLLRLQGLERADEKVPGPSEEVAVNSTKSKHDSWDTMKMCCSVVTKTESERDTNVLVTSGHMWKNKETFRHKLVDVRGLSPGRTQGTSFSSHAMDEMLGSPQGSESYEAKSSAKTATQIFLCDQSSHQSTFPERVDNTEIGIAATDQENATSQGSSLSKDQEMHRKEKPHECMYCGKVFRNTSYLIVHLRTQEGCRERFSQLISDKTKREELYICSECGKSLSNNSSLQKHQRTHRVERPYSCSHCGKCFSQRCVLWRHTRTHAGERLYTCMDCGKSFCDKNSFITHHRAHAGEKHFGCSECGKMFVYAANLVKHKKLHTGEEPFQCSDCGKYFCDKKSLSMHRRTHAGEKPYTCSECDKNISWKGSLLKYKSTHIGEEPHQCSDSSKSFCDKQSLLTHQRADIGEKPYKCFNCGKRFGYVLSPTQEATHQTNVIPVLTVRKMVLSTL